MLLTGKNLTEVSFPLGGIGSGCIGLSGDGRLIDWEIYHGKANKNSYNGFSGFAVKAEKDDEVLDVRILQGDLPGAWSGSDHCGVGPRDCPWSGMPHFAQWHFDGEFPVARLLPGDAHFPGNVEIAAWSVLIPGDSYDSGLPAACFELTIENTQDTSLDYTLAGILSNPWKTGNACNRFVKENKISAMILENRVSPENFEYGQLCLSTDADDVSWQQYWYRGRWYDAQEIFWQDFSAPGKFRDRVYNESSSDQYNHDTSTLAVHFTLAPKEKRTVRMLVSWYSPWAKNDWKADLDELMKKQKFSGGNLWRSYYATCWESALEVAEAFWNQYDRLRRETFLFHDALFSSTIPQIVLEGVSANLAVLKSPTVIRLEDGTFWGWEGVLNNRGSCYGSCSHVWNYEQALAMLFPDLERTMREAHFKYNFNAEGSLNFRLLLPLGLQPEACQPAADGSFGEIIRCYREWKISGDSEFLRRVWPGMKKVMAFCWNPESVWRWDPQRTGVLQGRQHHTLDMELFGPNVWLTGHYLAALKAISEMAPFCNDTEFGEECRNIYQKGRKWVENHLFNGEYYIQKIDLDQQQILTQFDTPDYWDEEHHEIKYQIGDGCEIDMHLPQWYASLYGLGDILDQKQIKATLRSIFRYNFLDNVRECANVWRKFCVNDEGGVVICSWPEEHRRPVIPLPYYQEMMTGFEWAFASHLIMIGELHKGEKVIRAIRRRYDGYRRNPWNELECGNNYVRALASYAVLQAYSGFSYDMTQKEIGFAPKRKLPFTCFWALGAAWGIYQEDQTAARVKLLHGEILLEKLGVRFKPTEIRCGKKRLCWRRKQERIIFDKTLLLKQGQVIILDK